LEFLAQVATALNKPTNSFDQIDKLIAEEFETKDDISLLAWRSQKKFSLKLKEFNMMKYVLK
jgi:pantothenate kinase-related protein Tda10